MAERGYQGAGIGIERMNEVLKMLREKDMSVTEISMHLDICIRATRKYVGKLMDMGKISMRRWELDPRFKLYSIVRGAVDIPSVEPITPRRTPRKVEKLKTGPKPKRDKEKWNGGLQTVRTVPAQQFGVQRDELVAALFGKAA